MDNSEACSIIIDDELTVLQVRQSYAATAVYEYESMAATLKALRRSIQTASIGETRKMGPW